MFKDAFYSFKETLGKKCTNSEHFKTTQSFGVFKGKSDWKNLFIFYSVTGNIIIMLKVYLTDGFCLIAPLHIF